MSKLLVMLTTVLALLTGCGLQEKADELLGNYKVMIVYEATEENPSKEELEEAAEIISQRLEELDYGKTSVKINGNQIEVKLTDDEVVESDAEAVAVPGELKFYDNYGIDLYTGIPIEGAEVLDNSHIKDANIYHGQTSENGEAGYYIELELTNEGREAFYEATSRNIGQPIYIMFDGEIVSAPTVQTAINDTKCIISGEFTQEEAQNLAAIISHKALPVELEIKEINRLEN